MSGGTILAASATANFGGLDLIGAYNKANAVNIAQSGDPSVVDSSKPYDPYSNASASAANATAYDQAGYILGAKYKIGNFSVGYAFAHGEQTKYTTGTAASATAAPGANVTNDTSNANVNMVGVGYQATPAVLLGLNYMITTADSSMWNAQARYSLSKRTTAYFQGSMAKNGSGATNMTGAAYGNFMPVNTNSSTFNKNVGGYGLVSGSSFSGGLPNTNVAAFGVGLIHNF
jgi:predicted porin